MTEVTVKLGSTSEMGQVQNLSDPERLARHSSSWLFDIPCPVLQFSVFLVPSFVLATFFAFLVE